MRYLASSASILGLVAATSVARADGVDHVEQSDQVTFGATGAYVPAQNSLAGDLAAFGAYAAYAHEIDYVYIGFRLALLYAWFPGGMTGQQYVIEPDVLIGLRWKPSTPIALRLEAGSGPLVDGGEGFTTGITNHTYVRGAFQWTIVKSLTLEAFAGPSFVIGPYLAGVFPEWGLGAGWQL